VINPAVLDARKVVRGPQGKNPLPLLFRGLDTEDGGLTEG